MLVALVALFGAGVVSFAAPCVLPLVPVFLGLVTGEVAGGRPQRALPATALFVAGFGGVFVAVGAGGGALGAELGDSRGVATRVGGALMVVFGLLLAGSGRRWARRTWRLRLRLPSGAVARPLVVGVVFGTAWTPCVGPLLGAALVAAAGTSSAWRGAAALGAYAAGLGAPFLFLAAGLSWVPVVHRGVRRASPVLHGLSAVFLVVAGLAALAGRLDRVLSLGV